MTTLGVMLAGCGVYDGSEIHEAVITLLALDRAGVKVLALAPEMQQLHVINHQTGSIAPGAVRQVVPESARIVRGPVQPTSAKMVERLDGLIIPGGFGAAKNLCDFAGNGADCRVEPSVAALVQAMVKARKPVGAICIAPVMVVKALQPLSLQPVVTIGTDRATAAAIEAMGGLHRDCPVDDIVVDARNNLVSTPAYMLATRISEAALGIEKLVMQIISLATR